VKVKFKPSHTQYLALQLLLGCVISRFILLGGGAGGGKSWLICEWLLYMCYVYPGTKWFIARNELKRLMATTYITFQKVCTFHNIPDSDWKLNGQYNYIQFKNGSRIDLLDVKFKPSDPLYEDLGSTEYTGGAIEEAGEVHELVFEVLKTRIGRHMNTFYGIVAKILLTCNPKQNWLKERFYDPWIKGTLEKGFRFVQSLARDNPHNSEQYIDDLDNIKDPVMRARLAKGDWNYESDPYCIFDIDAIYSLCDNKYMETAFTNVQPFLTVDPAAEGKDRTIITYWRGWSVKKIYSFEAKDKNQALPEAQDFIESLRDDFDVPKNRVIVEMDGLGVGLVQYGGYGGIRVGSGAVGEHKEVYSNLRAQLFFNMAAKVNDANIYVDPKAFTEPWMKETLEKELKSIKKAHPDSDEKKKAIIKREEIIKDSGRSPDMVSSWLPRFYAAIIPPAKMTKIKGYV